MGQFYSFTTSNVVKNPTRIARMDRKRAGACAYIVGSLRLGCQNLSFLSIPHIFYVPLAMENPVIIGGAMLYLGDCLEIMPTLGKVDAVVTDPPFFTPAVHYQSRVKHARSWGDMSILESWWGSVSLELARLCPLGHVFIFCGGESYPAFYKAMFSYWEKLKCMVWDKGHVGLGRIFRNQHELIIWARSEGHYVPDDGELRADILRADATPSTKRLHPVEKPPVLLSQLISASKGGCFDPFMGSGTTGVACVSLGRKFIGIEIEPKYFDIACKRIDQAERQGQLFEPKPPKAEQLRL